MEQQITGREVMMFITKFRLWDATRIIGTYLEDLDGTWIDFRMPGYGCNECRYALFSSGLYIIDAWVEEENRWERIETGDIFELDKVLCKEELK